MLAWAALVPLAHLPALLVGERPSALAVLVFLAASALAIGAALTLGRSPLLERAAARLEPVAGRLLWIAIALFAVVSMFGAAARLAGFGESTMLGLFGQCYWTQLHGHVFANSQEALDGTLVSHFGLHFSPTLLVLLPFFAMWPHPLVLMAGQVLAVALVPVPLFHLLRRRVGASAALPLALAVFGLPVFASSGFVDFRDSSFLPVLLLSAVWAMDARRWGRFALFTLAALGMREDTGLTLVALGAFALASGAGLRVGAVVAGVGAAWFLLVPSHVMSRFWAPGLIMDPRHFFATMFARWGETPGAAVIGILTHPAAVARTVLDPESLRYLYGLLAPLLLLPPWGDWAALVALPGIAVSLLASFQFMRSAQQPYALVPLAFLLLATLRSAARVAQRAHAAERAATALALGMIVLAGTVPALALSWPGPGRGAPPAAAAARVVAAIPPEVPVYSVAMLYPYLFRRDTFDTWENVGTLAKQAEFRARYGAIVLWPASDAPGAPWNAALAESLEHDSNFVERPGFEPFRLFERR